VQPSMGSVGDAYDNARCESFFATLECELLDRRRFASSRSRRSRIGMLTNERFMSIRTPVGKAAIAISPVPD
jgi:transposase InsO family protein